MFGVQIKKFREQCGLSQKTLARKIGVSEKADINWEFDVSNPTSKNMLTLADVFSVSLDALYGRQAPTLADLTCLPDNDRQLVEVMINAAIQYARQNVLRSEFAY